MNTKSDPVIIKASAAQILDYVSNFLNFEGLLPEEVEDWKATANECFFRIKGLVNLGLLMQEKAEGSHVLIVNHPDVSIPFSFSLRIDTEALSPQETKTQASIETKINPMMGMMVKKPLQNFVDTLIVRLKEKMEE